MMRTAQPKKPAQLLTKAAPRLASLQKRPALVTFLPSIFAFLLAFFYSCRVFIPPSQTGMLSREGNAKKRARK